MDVIETDTADVQVNSAGATSYVNNYKILNMLGEGTFSKVYLCQNDAGDDFALKIINKSILKRKREYKRVGGKLVLSNAFQKVQKEVAIMKKLAHSNLVRLYEVIDSPADDKLFLVLELIRGGQIMYWDDKKFRYFSRNTPTGVLDKETVRECMRDVVAALDFLHRNHICHRDIKPENILLSGRQYKLADFGVAYMNDDEPSAAVKAGDPGALKLRSTEGTYHFLAPECTTGEEYDAYQVDVWALGVTMFTLLVGALPFGTGVASLSDVMTSIREDPLVLPPDLDAECAELLTQLMEKNPQLRITVPQLTAHPWVSGSGGELARRPSALEVIVTQQEIEAAFTPVNNFILVMKLKMKMSSRLNNVRKSLAGKANSTRRTDAVPVTEHVPVSASENKPSDDSVEMAPGEQPRMPTDRLQRRSSRLMESITESMGSLSTTLTRRKSQLGPVSPVFDSAAPTAASPENSPGKADAGGRPGVLRRQLSRRSSRSVQSLVPDISQRTDSAKTIETAENRDDRSPGRTAARRSSHDNPSPTGRASPDKARLTKRKSSSSRGFVQPIETAGSESTAEPSSPTTTKKRRESIPGKIDSSSIISFQKAAQHVAVVSPDGKDTSPSKTESSRPSMGLTRRDSMSFRALVATPELLSPRNDTTDSNAAQKDTIASHGADTSTPPLTSSRPVMLSRRMSRRNSRSLRGISTASDSLKTEGNTQDTEGFPNLTRRKHSLVKADFSVPAVVPMDSADSADGDNASIKPESTSPSTIPRGLSRRNSTPFVALVTTPEVPKDGDATVVEGADTNDAKAGAAIAGPDSSSSESKFPANVEPKSPPSLLARRISRRDSTSLRALPLKVDVEDEDAKHDRLTRRATLSKLSPGKKETDGVDDVLPSTSPTARSVDITHSLQMNSSRSPLGSPKPKANVDEKMPLRTLQKPKLPVLDLLSPIVSPVPSPAASPRKAAELPKEEESPDSSPPKRRFSNPSSRAETEVPPLSRKRSSSLRLDGLPSGSEGEKQSAFTRESDACTASTVNTNSPTASTAPLVVTTPDVSARRATLSTSTPTAPLPAQETSPLRSPHRKRSVNAVDGEDSAFARMSSLAKVLDTCITTDRASERRIEEAAETEAPLSPLTPTRRHPMHVPPLERPGDLASRQTHTMVSNGRHHHVSPLGSIEKPADSPKSPPSLTKQSSRRKSLVEAQDSLRLLFRGQSSVRFGLLEEKRGANRVSDDKLSRIKSKVCVLM